MADMTGDQTQIPSSGVPEPRPEDSTTTKAELKEKAAEIANEGATEPPSKKPKLDPAEAASTARSTERKKGVAPIKQEYLIQASNREGTPDDDAAEAVHHDRPSSNKKASKGGQNKGREFGYSREGRGLCASRATAPEFSPSTCQYGDECKFEHDLRTYLSKWKQVDLTTLGGQCPVWEARGHCDAGWRCRFVKSHSDERELPDGRKELVLKESESQKPSPAVTSPRGGSDTVNNVETQAKISLQKKKMPLPKSDKFTPWLDSLKIDTNHRANRDERFAEDDNNETNGSPSDRRDNAAQYKEPPFLPSEKRRIYFGAETPVLAPLTTQGNLPFRALCVSLGAELTYSEMAMSQPLVQGQKSEWALLRAHTSEGTLPPKVLPDSQPGVGYEHGKDIRFGAQIAGNKPFWALKATEALTTLCPHLRVIDLNCGCPIDLVYRQGAGSALLDSPARLERILYGMGAVSGETPITAKIRTGTRDNKPTAEKLVDRLVYGEQSTLGPDVRSCGIAAITLHGRSRQQRYTKSADWAYIASCAALIERHHEKGDALADTAREPDARDQPAGGRVYFLGNGDCYSHEDYHQHLDAARVDAVMVARGAIVKPWIFEEIAARQYLDKTATERLGLVERYVRRGLEAWGADAMGVNMTRRFVLEYLSFAYRYVPVGLLEHLPPSLQDRPPAFRGRNELETLLASGNYKDWIKISEMFLGPVGDGFKFQPKHKSNSYEIEAEG